MYPQLGLSSRGKPSTEGVVSAPKPSNISAYTNRGQGVFLVLHTLQSLGGTNTKQDVIGSISHGGWYDVTRHDLPPYENKSEPKYHTLLAWARKDCYERDWMLKTDLRDDWAISRDGRQVLENAVRKYRSGTWDVRKCYLWTRAFKKLINPNYVPSDQDALRPPEKPDFATLLAELEDAADRPKA